MSDHEVHGEMEATLRRLALQAGARIMEIYAQADLGTRQKADASPVTLADEAADALISAGLAQAFPDIPVVTEEQAASHELRAARFLIVDPLDGTKEFVQEHARKRMEVEERFLEQVQKLPDLQCSWVMLSQSAVPRANHTIRILPPSLSTASTLSPWSL